MGVVGEVILEHATRVGLVHDEHGRLVVDDARCAVLDSLHVTDPSARSLTAQTRSVVRSHWEVLMTPREAVLSLILALALVAPPVPSPGQLPGQVYRIGWLGKAPPVCYR